MNKSLLFLILPFFVFAQIPNPGFENWTEGEPDGWWTLNFPGISSPVTQSMDPHAGTYALRGEIKSFFETPYPPQLGVGEGAYPYAPISQKYNAVHGFLKFIPQGMNDQFVGLAFIYSTEPDTQIIAAGTIEIGGVQEEYTPFEMHIDYLPNNELNAGLIYLSFLIDFDSTNSIGSYFVLDDLSLSTITGLEKHLVPNPKAYSLEQNYPNPFNPTTKINYQLPVNSHARLVVYDINGRVVKTLLDRDHSAGSYSIDFDGSALPSGVYFYRLTAASFSETKRMLLVK